MEKEKLMEVLECVLLLKDGASDVELIFEYNLGNGFKDADGFSYTNFKSRVPVKFPYYPKTIYVKRQRFKRILNFILNIFKKRK